MSRVTRDRPSAEEIHVAYFRGTGKRNEIPTINNELPELYEDEGIGMGETRLHVLTQAIIWFGVWAHLAERKALEVLANVNCYYDPDDASAYVAPDVMIVEPFQPLPLDVSSYTIDEEGPPPLLTVEVLSRRSWQKADLSFKPFLYGRLGVPEYVLVDVLGEFLADKLLLMKLRADGTYVQKKDADGGVTSRFGFRLIIDADGHVRVLDSKTGHRYARPNEADERIRKLEQEVQRLTKKPTSGRRRQKRE